MKAKIILGFAFLAFQFSFANMLFVDPIALNLPPLTYCDPNNDGTGIFDLSSLNEQILLNQGDSNTVNYSIGYYETNADAVTGTNPSLLSPYNNINPWVQTIYYRVTNLSTNAYAVGTFQLIVNPTPVATMPTDYHLCDYTGAVGSESFDLTTVIPQVLGAEINPATASVYFFTDADLTNPIVSATSFTNTIIWHQTVYVQVLDIATGCYDVVPLQLYVDPIPVTLQPNYPPYSICDISDPMGYGTFDLTTQIPNIVLGQTGMSVTFYPSYSAAIAGVNMITNPSAYVNTPIYVQTLGIRVTNNVTGCYSVSTMDIRLDPKPQLIPPAAPYTICDSNQDGVGFFDLTTLIPMIDPAGLYNISFHETVTDATLNGMEIPNPHDYSNNYPFMETLYVRGEDPVTGCFSILPVQLVVNPSPILPTLPSLVLCDQDSNPQNGITLCDLTVQTQPILAYQPFDDSDYNLSYFTSQSNADSDMGPILNPTAYTGSNGQTIWYRVANIATGCYAVGSFQLIINSPLVVTTPTPLVVCDSDANPNDQFASFDLTVKDAEITQGHLNYTVTYYPSVPVTPNSVPISNPTAFVNGQSPVQTLGVKVTSPEGCVSYTSLDIRVMPVPLPNEYIPTLTACDGNGDGVEVFNLATNAAYLTNGNPFAVMHFYPTLTAAENNTNEIAVPTAYPSASGSVWISISNYFTDYQGIHCHTIVQQNLQVTNNLLPVITTNTGNNTACVDWNTTTVTNGLVLHCSIVNANYSYHWYKNGIEIPGTNSSDLAITLMDDNQSVYTVSVASDSNANPNCSGMSSDFVVYRSGTASPIDVGYALSNISDTLQNITVNVEGYGVYQFQLDGGPFQYSPVFTNIPLGPHFIIVADSNGCGNLELPIGEVPAPTGTTIQSFAPGATLADIIINGNAIQWYDTATAKNAAATPLPLNTLLVNGATYYASQTINGVESTTRLAVTVYLVLGVDTAEVLSLYYAPNPVKNTLNIQSGQTITSVVVYTMLGQKVREQVCNTSQLTLDLSDLKTGSYLVKVTGTIGQKTLRIIKE